MRARTSVGDSLGVDGPARGRDRWLLSYGDFMTLLLALFVVLYATARADAQKNDDLFAGMREAFFFESNSPSPLPPDQRADVPESPRPAPIAPARLPSVEDALRLEIADHERRTGQQSGVSLHQSERGLVLSLASTEFFPAGGVEIPEERQAILASMAPLLAAQAQPLLFEGHTDAAPIRSDLFPSNWELSTARAAAVARFFIDRHGIDPTRVAATGYAEFRPVTRNDELADRARNRRVEIVLLQDGRLVPQREADPRQDLDRLLEALPPLPERADQSLRSEDAIPRPAAAPPP